MVEIGQTVSKITGTWKTTYKGSMVTVASCLHGIKLKNRYRKISNGSNQWFEVYIDIIPDEGLPAALCLDRDLIAASERPAADLFGSTVARKLHDSGQNCAGDIFLFGLAKVESVRYGQEKTRCLWSTGRLWKHARECCWLPAFNAVRGARWFRSARAWHRQHRPGTIHPLGCGHPVSEVRDVWDSIL